MKTLVILAVLSVHFLLATWVRAEEMPYARMVVEPAMKYFDSDGKSAMKEFNGHHRQVRAPSTCAFPTAMEDSQLDCKLYPSRVQCTQTCMFGHTLNDGIRREMKCRYDENKWTPVPQFEKCRPFVDCSMSITAGGRYKCLTNFMDKGSTCEVSCEHYEDKDAVPKASYQCDITGKWTPKLPFCARAGTGIKLVPPPNGPKIPSK